ncbi:hypothetical protein ACDF64_01775 [Agromyces sp. MMS24-JH15]|uniref:hypothetical protein n=1 Tax=Agromyces sp. MMS24-JH15 TaxID=3243765 RepID=UPI003747CD83
MSSERTPSGRPSPAVYRRRRLVVLLGLVAVIVAVVLIIVRPGSSQGDESDATPPTGSAGATDPATPAADAPATVLPTTEPTTPPEGMHCKTSQVEVVAITDRTEYQAGEQPNLMVSVTNTGTAPCVINAGTKAQVFTVTSGAEKYWVSTDCQTDPIDAEVTLAPGVPVSSAVAIVWDRTRSSPDTCGVAREAVPAGGASYHLTVSVDGIESVETKQFLLY